MVSTHSDADPRGAATAGAQWLTGRATGRATCPRACACACADLSRSILVVVLDGHACERIAHRVELEGGNVLEGASWYAVGLDSPPGVHPCWPRSRSLSAGIVVVHVVELWFDGTADRGWGLLASHAGRQPGRHRNCAGAGIPLLLGRRAWVRIGSGRRERARPIGTLPRCQPLRPRDAAGLVVVVLGERRSLLVLRDARIREVGGPLPRCQTRWHGNATRRHRASIIDPRIIGRIPRGECLHEGRCSRPGWKPRWLRNPA